MYISATAFLYSTEGLLLHFWNQIQIMSQVLVLLWQKWASQY